jgi:hypothetical protein
VSVTSFGGKLPLVLQFFNTTGMYLLQILNYKLVAVWDVLFINTNGIEFFSTGQQTCYLSVSKLVQAMLILYLSDVQASSKAYDFLDVYDDL